MNDFLSVTGRIVSGNAFQPQPDKTDPQTGVTRKGGYFVGVAVPKTDPAGTATKAAIEAAAVQAWPGGEHAYPTFSSKIADGDLPPKNQKEGYPGCWVFGFSQGWPFQVVSQNAASVITDPKGVKKGDYVRVPFTVKGNGAKTSQNQTPGMYVNAVCIEFVGYGEAIMSGPDPVAALAGLGQAQMPAGATATPTATGPTAGPSPGMTAPPPAAGQPATPPPPPPAANVQPHPGFLNPPVMTAAANGITYDAYIAQGWTEDLLISQGMMAPRGV